jgi:hypothetical protein
MYHYSPTSAVMQLIKSKANRQKLRKFAVRLPMAQNLQSDGYCPVGGSKKTGPRSGDPVFWYKV